ncbi:unnamed protein product, partial [Prorocentrum cordatum]
VIGALVGSIEMSIMKPAVFWKSELQQGRFSISRAVNPAYCYRGLPVAVCSIAPVTCIQFVANNVALRRFGAESTASDSQRLAAGVLSGFASALAQSPMQLVEINQTTDSAWWPLPGASWKRMASAGCTLATP